MNSPLDSSIKIGPITGQYSKITKTKAIFSGKMSKH
jgi:hypothetical protein